MTLALALAAAGFVASVLNVLAGGGSFITLPVLIFFGLPAGEANATNRVGVLAQNVGAVWGFHRHGVLDWGWALRAALPGTLGAVVGALLALRVGDHALERTLAVLMLCVAAWTVVGSDRDRGLAAGAWRARPGALAAGFFAAGVYAGFIQAGVGFLMLALTSWAGLDLVRGNAVKVLGILAQTGVSLLVFAAGAKVDWTAGAALAAGSLAGSWVGVRLTVVKGQRWLQRVVTVTIVVFALALLLD